MIGQGETGEKCKDAKDAEIAKRESVMMKRTEMVR
jgi:hypothetical protein